MKYLSPFLFILVILCLPAHAFASDAAKEQLLKTCEQKKYTYSPELRAAYLAYAKKSAMDQLDERGKPLPPEFLTWVDKDPSIAAGVYAAHPKPEDVLLWLYSLRLDLGKAKFEQYRHLALAAALVSAKEGLEPDINIREPLKLVIPGDPRKPANTKAKDRTLDVNDHIINFLTDNTIDAVVPVGKIEPPELKYDDRGIAIPAPPSKQPGETKKVTRSLYAADVLASRELQQKFNAYMKERGQKVYIDCGDKVVHWNSTDAVQGEQRKKVEEAYRIFRAAYEAKGLLPAQRDPFPSPAERCAYMIRNHAYIFPPELREKRKWPRFPLDAPWPMLTMLAADRQPLREREERWIAFRDRGEVHTYGEYIGAVAQQFSMQSARRLKPYAFSYTTVQMMLKDGGVCGTMGSIAARGGVSLGVPACQATQPGHCAYVFFQFDPKKQTYACKGGQYAGVGDEKTGPFTPWPFEARFRRMNRTSGHEIEYHDRKPMIYHQAMAWGMNYDAKGFMDATIAHAVFQLLPDEQRKSDGIKLLESGLALNPYHFLLVDAALASAATPQEQIQFWKQLNQSLTRAKGKPGCPTQGLYNTTVKNKVFARIAKMSVPKDTTAAKAVLAFLEKAKCEDQKMLDLYRSPQKRL
ncbi:MAG: hypothetical protein ACI9TH_002658 [Kiritimatiellia bacterium]|jgi:hypothetical protein